MGALVYCMSLHSTYWSEICGVHVWLKKAGKIFKIDKILRWRVNFTCYSFDIKYRSGKDNVTVDTLSRAYCSAVSLNTQEKLCNSIYHPSITRIMYFVRSRNPPFSVKDVKRESASCTVCAEGKSRFYQPDTLLPIKVTIPFERLSVDFKGPLPSSRKRFLFTVKDEYFWFSFAFACLYMSPPTVIKRLTQLIVIFRMPR